MKNNKRDKKLIISLVVTILLTTLISLFSFSSGSFSEYGYVDAINYAAKRERSKNGVDFTYAEASPTTIDNIYNDALSTNAVTFDNYWHFDNRPNIYAFKKWGESINPSTNEKVFPLNFDYLVNGETNHFQSPIISMIGNRWESEKVISHLELKTINSIENFNLNDSKAIQDSVIMSYELANKLCPGNVEYLIGKTITDNVVYLNSRYNEAHYNNSPSKDTIKSINIIGVFDSESSKKMARFTGDVFVFMFGGKEGTYNHCGQKLAVHFSNDDYANDISISQFLLLDNNKSKITFYDYDGASLSVGNLQSTYESAKTSKSPLMKILGPMLSVGLLSVTVVFFVIFVIRRKTLIVTTVSILSLTINALFVYFLKYLNFGNFYLVLLNPIGSLVFVLTATIMFALLLKGKRNQNDLSVAEKRVENFSKTRPLFMISLILLSLSSYLLLHSVLFGRKYFLLTELLIFVGMVVCSSFCAPLRTNQSKRILITNLIFVVASFVISLLLIFGLALVVPTIQFNIKTLLISLATYIAINCFIHIFYLLKRKALKNSSSYNYMEIKL